MVLESLLARVGVRRPFRQRGVAKYRNGVIALLLVLGATMLGTLFLRPTTVPDLAAGNASALLQMKAGWAKGEMIVLVRHVERCDHSRAACLNAADGITDRARSVAVGLGAQFERLGLANADLYNSPLTRAVQTSSFMFNSATAGQDWLFHCKGTMLRDVLAHKVPGRNLVLVTHSECMAELEKQLKVPTATLGYGAALFLAIDKGNAHAHLLGSLDATDWHSVFAR